MRYHILIIWSMDLFIGNFIPSRPILRQNLFYYCMTRWSFSLKKCGVGHFWPSHISVPLKTTINLLEHLRQDIFSKKFNGKTTYKSGRKSYHFECLSLWPLWSQKLKQLIRICLKHAEQTGNFIRIFFFF
jgi:hypothetical protein